MAKVQVNNFLDSGAAGIPAADSDQQLIKSKEGELEKKKEENEYLKELEMINDLPELLLG